MSGYDWKTARVVRDGKGRLRTGDGPIYAWSVGEGLSEEAAAAYEHTLGGLTPVLDADGLPVVRTVGDLTARHIGRVVRVEGMRRSVLLAMRQPVPDEPLVALLVRMDGDITSTDYLPLDTPCEVLP